MMDVFFICFLALIYLVFIRGFIARPGPVKVESLSEDVLRKLYFAAHAGSAPSYFRFGGTFQLTGGLLEVNILDSCDWEFPIVIDSVCRGYGLYGQMLSGSLSLRELDRGVDLQQRVVCWYSVKLRSQGNPREPKYLIAEIIAYATLFYPNDDGNMITVMGPEAGVWLVEVRQRGLVRDEPFEACRSMGLDVRDRRPFFPTAV